MRRREFLAQGAAAATVAVLPQPLARAQQGAAAPHGMVLRSGSMHYPRVPRPYWRDRMHKLRALGLNTLCTYVFWNLHEPRPGEFDFSGNLDLAAYLRAAQQEGLFVILRPGPYICTEWDFGGFPAWLLAPTIDRRGPQPAGPATAATAPGRYSGRPAYARAGSGAPEPQAGAAPMQVRTSDPRFLAAAGRYLRRVGREVAPLQGSRGGPLVMAQVENEYGSFGQDHAYMAAIRDLMREAGFEVPLYTADGPSPRLLSGGTLNDLPCAINFGDGDDPEGAFATLAQFRPNGLRMCGEYWVGWFDHWGERHHTTPPERAARGLEWMLANNISCNLYMAHGGTSFGFMAGANYGRTYQPDTTSYDYDAPLDEAGRPTAKFQALHEVYLRHLNRGERLPDLPSPLPVVTIPEFELPEQAGLSQLWFSPRESPQPLPMEALGQAYGLIWYRAQVPANAQGILELEELRDYARIYQQGRELGRLDRSLGQNSLEVTLAAGTLDIIVENMGRINFGPKLQDNLQGITERVRFNGSELTGWSVVPLPLDDLSRLRFSTAAAPHPGPAFYRGAFNLDGVGDTFLDLRGWGKGYVWVNDHNLGRYWERGPQQTLYLPGCWLRRGKNEVIVFDWDTGRLRQLAGLADPIYARGSDAA